MLCFLTWFDEDQDVIDIDNDIYNNLKEFIHHSLECCRSISLPKEHHHAFVCPTSGGKCHHSFISFSDVNVDVTQSKIQLDKVVAFFQLIHKFSNKQNGVVVLDH